MFAVCLLSSTVCLVAWTQCIHNESIDFGLFVNVASLSLSHSLRSITVHIDGGPLGIEKVRLDETRSCTSSPQPAVFIFVNIDE